MVPSCAGVVGCHKKHFGNHVTKSLRISKVCCLQEIRLYNDNIAPWRYIFHPLHPCKNLRLGWCLVPPPKKLVATTPLDHFFRRGTKNHGPSPPAQQQHSPKWPEVSDHLEVELDKTRRSQYLTVGFCSPEKSRVFFSDATVFFLEQWWLLSWLNENENSSP